MSTCRPVVLICVVVWCGVLKCAHFLILDTWFLISCCGVVWCVVLSCVVLCRVVFYFVLLCSVGVCSMHFHVDNFWQRAVGGFSSLEATQATPSTFWTQCNTIRQHKTTQHAHSLNWRLWVRDRVDYVGRIRGGTRGGFRLASGSHVPANWVNNTPFYYRCAHGKKKSLRSLGWCLRRCQ